MDDYLEGCSVFLDCDGTGRAPDIIAGAFFSAVTDQNGAADFAFTGGVGEYEDLIDTCDFVFDATISNQPQVNGESTCVNTGTQQNTKVSQICQGNGNGCDVMSNLCTLYGYSSMEQMSVAFSPESIPNMGYGACQPCICDPIAEIVGNTDLSTSAENQLAGITSTLGFVTLCDTYFSEDGEFPWPAALSPGRQALTKAVDEATSAFDFTDSAFTLQLLLSAQEFYNDQLPGGRRKMQDNMQELENFADLLSELNAWYTNETEFDSGIEHINTANEFAALTDFLFNELENSSPSEVWEDTLDSGSEGVVSDIVEEQAEDIRIRTFSPTPMPTVYPEWEICNAEATFTFAASFDPQFMVSDGNSPPNLLFVAGANSVNVFDAGSVAVAKTYANFEAQAIGSSTSPQRTLAVSGQELYLLLDGNTLELEPLLLAPVSISGTPSLFFDTAGNVLVVSTDGSLYDFDDVETLIVDARRTTSPTPVPVEEDGGGDMLPIIIGVVVAAVVVGTLGWVMVRRKGSGRGKQESKMDKTTSLTTVDAPDREIINMQDGETEPRFMVADMDDNELPSASI